MDRLWTSTLIYWSIKQSFQIRNRLLKIAHLNFRERHVWWSLAFWACSTSFSLKSIVRWCCKFWEEELLSSFASCIRLVLLKVSKLSYINTSTHNFSESAVWRSRILSHTLVLQAKATIFSSVHIVEGHHDYRKQVKCTAKSDKFYCWHP